MNHDTYSLTIDEVKEISKYIQSKDSKRSYIGLSFYTASAEAQNAMLKMLEDYNGTRFILSVPNHEVLLDTVRSRLMDVSDMADDGLTMEYICKKVNGNLLLIKKDNSKYRDLAIKYITMSTQDRLKLPDVEDMIKKEIVNANKSVTKSKDDIHRFLISITRELLNKYKTNMNDDIKEQINQYNKLARQMMQSSASAKMIMDYVAYRLRV